jgi:RNA polymerase sigma-B factor
MASRASRTMTASASPPCPAATQSPESPSTGSSPESPSTGSSTGSSATPSRESSASGEPSPSRGPSEEPSSRGPSPAVAARGPSKHPHDDAPDTSAAFERLASLPEGPEKEQIRQDVVTAWLPLAHRMAWRYRNRGEALDDLRQVAALGLVKAVRRYDPRRGIAFESYAVPTVDGELKRHFRDYMWTVHVPRRVQDLRSRIRKARQELVQNGAARGSGRAPTATEIAAHAGLTEQEVADGMEAMESFTSLSLDAQFHGSSDGFAPSLSDTLGESDPAIDVVIDREAVKPRLCELPPRERKVLYLRFFRDMTQSKIAEDLGVSQMHVSRLLSRSCSRIRAEVLSDVEADAGEEAAVVGRDSR